MFAQWGEPLVVTLSTHIDTVPPFFTSREDDDHIWGRGACDTKGIIASMIKAVEALLEGGQRGFGLLFVVGEERNSAGAYKAAQTPRGSRYIINGEPTENQLALGRRALCATRSAPPARWPTRPIRNWATPPSTSFSTCWPRSAAFRCRWMRCSGPSTLNFGTLAGGRALNVIPPTKRAPIS